MLYTTVNFNQFCDAFADAGRQDQFSEDAMRALYDMLNEGDSVDDNIELDVIELCCGYAEMTVDKARDAYQLADDEDVAEYLSANSGWVAELPNGDFIFEAF